MSGELTLISDIRSIAAAVEALAFKMPAPNPYTPQFVQLAIAARGIANEAEVERRKRLGLGSITVELPDAQKTL